MSLLLRAGAALVAAQVALLLSAESDSSAALRVAAKVALGVGIAFIVLDVGRALLTNGRVLQVAWVSGNVTRSWGPWTALVALFSKIRPWHVLLVGLTLIVLFTAKTPARLTVNLVGFVAFAGPLWWLVQRGAGQRAATIAMSAVAVFAVVALTADRPTRQFIADWGAASPYKWSAGWPTAEWRLAQTISLPTGRDTPRGGYVLTMPLAQRYGGTSSVLFTVNGVEVGAARFVQDRSWLAVDVPTEGASADGDLRIEFRASPPDPALRILALRWTGGATMGAAASSYFDGSQWRAGTFNDAAGQAQLGVYVVRLEPAGGA